MIVVDSSALVAIYKDETEGEAFRNRLAGPSPCILPASCYLEVIAVLSKFAKSREWLDGIIGASALVFFPIDEPVVRLAADAFERYGKGRGHAAQLNFGDCLVYAAAKVLDAPLLFKGGDFARTDVRIAA